jgi:hypothetical protein
VYGISRPQLFVSCVVPVIMPKNLQSVNSKIKAPIFPRRVFYNQIHFSINTDVISIESRLALRFTQPPI